MSTQTSEQTTSPQAPATPVTIESILPFDQDQLEGARKAYEGLGQIFAPKHALKENKVGASASGEPASDHKTLADVGDKGLDMLREGATKALDLLGQGAAQIAATTEKAAPVVWKIMVKQQIANALAEMIGPVLLFMGAIIFHWVMNASFGEVTSDTGVFWKGAFGIAVPVIVGVVSLFWFIDAMQKSVQQLINPHYFAARDLIDIITRRGN